MRILFSPEYSRHVFTKACGAGVMMDTVVANVAGLINLLEIRLGLHYEEESEQERMAHYYNAVCQYMAINPKNVLAASFKTSGLGTAKAMLTWRDELRSANWDFDGAEISQRLEALIGVEDIFRKRKGCDMAGRLHIVTDQVMMQQLDCKSMTIVMACAKELLRPTTRSLLEALAYCGAKLEMQQEAEPNKSNLHKVRKMIETGNKKHIRLTKGDDSLLIWKFPDERAACEYLAHEDMNDVDVWINADNKQMDNWLTLMNKPKTGSVTADCAPQLTQLFVAGFGLFASPLNVNTLIEWLNMPVHPIAPAFRCALAYTIAKNGGYRNEECKQLIQKYIDGQFVHLTNAQKVLPEEQQNEIRQKDAKERKRQTEVYLPSPTRTTDILTENVRTFTTDLAYWARQRAHLMTGETNNSQWVEQLATVARMCDAMKILLDTVQTDTIDYKTIDSWMSTIFQKGAYTNAVAEVGCRTVIDAPSKMASVAEKTVWMGMDGDEAKHLECSFLHPSEKRQLKEKGYMLPWAEEVESRYNELMMLTPIRMTQRQLILVTCDRRGGEPTQKHPLLVRLEQQVDNLDKFVVTPQIDSDYKTEAEIVNHDSVRPELHFDHADKIKWPDHLSPTVIETLAVHPFDYLMERLLDITADAKAQMANVRTTMGNVAHGVIEALFAPRDDQRYSKPDDIAKRIEADYDDTFSEVMEAKGAILLLAENKLSVQLLKEQLHNCLNTLVEIIRANSLKVTGCERHVEGKLGLNLPTAYDKDGNEKDRDILGFIDMTLEDQDGHPVVFDFKWSSWKGFKEYLEKNRSVQLELYRWMLGQEQRDEVKSVAYFLMPEAHLYSKEKFIGNNCTQILPENNDNIVEQLRQSVRYRKDQIMSGVVETDGALAEMQYAKDTDEKNLFALEEGEAGTKKVNSLSPYELFKR